MEVKLIDVSPGKVKEDIASYLVYTDKYNLLIETGPSSSVKKIYQFMENEGITSNDLDYILVTHIHLDHAGAAGHIVEKNRSIMVYVHPRGFPHLINPSKLWSASKETLGSLARLYGPPISIPRKNLVRVDDEHKLDVGEDTILFIYTPGHSPHHMMILFDEHGYLFSGDAAGIHHVNALIPSTPKPHNPDKAILSLERIMVFHVERVYFTHFGMYEPGMKILHKAREKWSLWRDFFQSFYRRELDVEEAYSELLSLDRDSKIMNQYFKTRGYGEDELKVSVYGFLSYFYWLNNKDISYSR